MATRCALEPPAWWIRRLRQDYPADWERILQANNAHAPMALRVNQQKCTLAQYQQALAAINLEAKVVGRRAGAGTARAGARLPGFADGWVSVQDAAAQQAAPWCCKGWI